VLLIGLSVPVARSILRPVRRLGVVIDALAKGDLTVRSGITARDEVGRMAAGLDGALDSIRTSLAGIGANADGLAGSATQLSSVAARIAEAAGNTDAQSSYASAEAEEISRNVQTVAAGSEEMGLSIREISSNTSEAAQIAAVAVSESARATDTVRQLGESSVEIGNVIKLITSIAEQTNLLALNAAIEAARAGDAGRGFSVVADEVRKLAERTAHATSEIRSMISNVQDKAKDAVTNMDTGMNRMEEGLKLAEEAATDNSGMQEILERMLQLLQEISEGAYSYGGRVQGVATVTSSMRSALDELNYTVVQARQTAQRLHGLAGQFQVTQVQGKPAV
jgi:methyl-accepting chemotaxis protein